MLVLVVLVRARNLPLEDDVGPRDEQVERARQDRHVDAHREDAEAKALGSLERHNEALVMSLSTRRLCH